MSLISSFFFNSSLKAIRSIFSKGSPDNFENVSRCWFIRGVANIAKDGLESFIWPVKSVIIITVGAIGNYRPWGCSILSGSLSAWDREQGSEGQEEMQKGNRERLLRQRCGNSVAKFGSASWNESHQFFFFPSLRIIVGISLLWSIESCSRRIDIVFSLSYSFCLVVNEKDRILLDERFDSFEKKKEFRIDRRLYFPSSQIGTILGWVWIKTKICD